MPLVMNAPRALLALASAFLLGACAPEPDSEKSAPAPQAAGDEAAEARREAADAAREAMQKAGEAARKLGEAGSAAVEAAVLGVTEKAAERVAARPPGEGAEAAPVEDRTAVPTEDRGGDGEAQGVRDAKEAAEQAAHRIAEATRDAAQRLREVGKEALDSVRSRPESASQPPAQDAAPIEDRVPAPVEGGGESAGR